MLNRIIARISKPMTFHKICLLLSCWGVAIEEGVDNTSFSWSWVSSGLWRMWKGNSEQPVASGWNRCISGSTFEQALFLFLDFSFCFFFVRQWIAFPHVPTVAPIWSSYLHSLEAKNTEESPLFKRTFQKHLKSFSSVINAQFFG